MEHQVGFSAVETIWAKQNFERLCLDHGVIVNNYLADNQVFKTNAFVQHINEHQQQFRFCGTNAHHQNGIAKRAIQSVLNIARAMLLHAPVYWKDGAAADLWPMAINYATYMYNLTPKNGFYPADVFFGDMVPCHHLKDLHVWGYPVFVLDLKLQQVRNSQYGSHGHVKECLLA